MCVTWLIHRCGMTHSYLRHDTFIYMYMCDTTHSCETEREKEKYRSKQRDIRARYTHKHIHIFISDVLGSGTCNLQSYTSLGNDLWLLNDLPRCWLTSEGLLHMDRNLDDDIVVPQQSLRSLTNDGHTSLRLFLPRSCYVWYPVSAPQFLCRVGWVSRFRDVGCAHLGFLYCLAHIATPKICGAHPN